MANTGEDVATAKSVSPAEKKAAAERRNNYDLHVLLIMKQLGVPKSKALYEAYREGAVGLQQRLAGKVG